MQFRIKNRYDSEVDIVNLENPDDPGTDQYVPIYTEVGTFTVHIGVDPITGQMSMRTIDMIEASNPVVIDTRKKNGKQLTQTGSVYKLDLPIPIMDALGNVFEYKYRMRGARRDR